MPLVIHFLVKDADNLNGSILNLLVENNMMPDFKAQKSGL